MRHVLPLAAVLALLLTACASTDAEVTQQRSDTSALPYPQAIYVYDFAVKPAEVPPGSTAAPRLVGAIDDPDRTPEREALEREIAGVLARRLVAELQALGLPATRWRGTPPKNANSYTLEGQFLTIDEGNALERMIIGFGVGGTELRVLVQAYHVQDGRRTLLGEAEVSSQSSRKPGLAATLPIGGAISGITTAAAVSTGVGVVSEINADVRKGAEDTADAIVELLKPRMEAQGWF
jgi:hypothetical protein